MTENTNTELPPYNPNPGDWLLQDFVALINKLDMQVSITVQLGGMSVSGTIISGRTYFKRLGDQVAEAMSTSNVSDAAEAMRGYFSRHADMYASPTDTEEPYQRPGYIHIDNALFWGTDGKLLAPTGVLWRGRLSELSGFYLGALSKGAA